MRRRIAACLGLVLVVLLVTGLVVWFTPPLRVGRTEQEVIANMGQPAFRSVRDEDGDYLVYFPVETDWLGNQHYTVVLFDRSGHVAEWSTNWNLPRTHPPWLDGAWKWIGR